MQINPVGTPYSCNAVYLRSLKNQTMKLFYCLLISVTMLIACHPGHYLLVGTYTNNSPSKGINVYDFDDKNGSIKKLSETEAGNPSYLAVNKGGNFVYSVNETNEGKISAFAFDKKNATLTSLNSEKNNGSAPCYVAIDKTGKWLFAGNYSSGDLTVHPILPNGSIGPIKQLIKHSGSGPDKSRQQSPHVHCTFVSPDNQFLYVPDLGIDKVMIYPFDAANGLLDEKNSSFYKVTPAGGPRHISFTKNGAFGYLVEEMSGSVVALQRSGKELKEIKRVNHLPAGQQGAGADIHLSPDGNFLYVSQRSDHTIQIFKVNKTTGSIEYINSQSTLGEGPRNFSIHPSGKFLVVGNQNSNYSVIFKRNTKTGLLTDSGNRIEVGKPVCHIWVKK